MADLMMVRRLILLGVILNLIAAGATADTRVFRGPPCQLGAGGYLLAANSGAVIRISENSVGAVDQAVIVFHPPVEHGWASQRLLSRFDLELGEEGERTVRNSGAVCPRQSP